MVTTSSQTKQKQKQAVWPAKNVNQSLGGHSRSNSPALTGTVTSVTTQRRKKHHLGKFKMESMSHLALANLLTSNTDHALYQEHVRVVISEFKDQDDGLEKVIAELKRVSASLGMSEESTKVIGAVTFAWFDTATGEGGEDEEMDEAISVEDRELPEAEPAPNVHESGTEYDHVASHPTFGQPSSHFSSMRPPTGNWSMRFPHLDRAPFTAARVVATPTTEAAAAPVATCSQTHVSPSAPIKIEVPVMATTAAPAAMRHRPPPPSPTNAVRGLQTQTSIDRKLRKDDRMLRKEERLRRCIRVRKAADGHATHKMVSKACREAYGGRGCTNTDHHRGYWYIAFRTRGEAVAAAGRQFFVGSECYLPQIAVQ